MSDCFRFSIALCLLALSLPSSAQVPVQVQTIENRTIVKPINVTGTVTSPRTAVLSTAVSGIVKKLASEEGDRVKVGQVLLKLDAELAELALEGAMAEVRLREITLADATRRYTEAEKIGSQRGIAQTQIDSLKAEVTSSQAAVTAANIAAREQRAIVARHTLKAPFDGVINDRLTELGEWVTPGNGLFELIATDNLRFDFQVGQENFANLSAKSPVEMTLDALPQSTFQGYIDTIVPIKNRDSRTFLVRALVEDKSDTKSGSNSSSNAGPKTSVANITPGMSVRGVVKVDSGRSGLTVSRDALLRFPDGRITVWAVDTQGNESTVRERVVVVGLEFDGVVEVTRGLAEGDVVVIRGNETLQEGQAVTILESGN